ncbi:MAG: hypothetical protein JWN31_1444 [Frankiales bacterium]|nr:hypothetical protein [Frankiales bacterium]
MTSDWAYPDRTGESIESSGAEIISIDQVVEAEDGLDVEQDGVDSLRDIEAEANDEQGLRDRSIADRDENNELGLTLDRTGQPEPELD